ncbi:MAG: PKD domain-containing protein [Planctomycetota bacterium]|nr:MAG: PKD domain-containing protein [Planctomycetota bacterium]
MGVCRQLFFICAVSVTVVAITASLFAVSPPGPLQVHSINPRYCDDGSGKAILLSGSHIWINMQDYGPTDPPAAFDYASYLDFLQGLNHSFMRGWHWEQPKYFSGRTTDYYIDPVPFLRTGPGTAQDGKLRFDVTKYYQPYFDRIRARAIEAGNHGLYISIMLFEGFSIEDKGRTGTDNPWWSHPLNQTNNVNGLNGDPNGDGQGKETHTLQVPAITAIQEDYVEYTIDQLNDLDNILWEISNESHAGSVSWQYHIINHIKSYEAAYKPKQHLVCMNGWGEDFHDSYLFDSPADVISPSRFDTPSYRTNPPVSDGSKIVMLDTDHLWGLGGNADWVWKCFTRGYHVIFMDPYPLTETPAGKVTNPNDPTYVALRQALGHIMIYADKLNLATALPSTTIATTTNCLADPGMEYLVYQPNPGSSFNVDLQSGGYDYEWFNVSTGSVAETGSFAWGGGNMSFTPPFNAPSVLYLQEGEGPVALISAVPQSGTSPLAVNFDGSASYDQSGGSIINYAWDFFNDGSRTATGVTAGYTYRSSITRNFTAKLTVTDDDTYSDSETVIITVQPGQIGDFDGDGDVDQEDFGHFQACMTGTGNQQNGWDCLDTLLDTDDDVDLVDFGIFQGCMNGANQSPGC